MIEAVAPDAAEKTFAYRVHERGLRGGAQDARARSLCDAVKLLSKLVIVVPNDDPQPRDESLDWCAKNGQYISKPRLKSLLRTLDKRAGDEFAPFGQAIA